MAALFANSIFNTDIFNAETYSGGYETYLPDNRSFPVPRRAAAIKKDRETFAAKIANIDAPQVAQDDPDEAPMLLFLTL